MQNMQRQYTLRSPESYVTGPYFDRVRVEGISHGTVVMTYDPVRRGGSVGLFINPSESHALKQMLRELKRADFTASGLEAKLTGLSVRPNGNDPVSQQMQQSRAYIVSALESFGVSPAMIKQRYSSSSGLASVTVNLRTGRLVVWTTSSAVKASMLQSERMRELLQRAEAEEAESFDPHDPPEPSEERFWRLREQRRR